jgi:hypothetical protein
MHLLRRNLLARRSVLRGIAGGSLVSVGLPLLESMCSDHGHALAAGAPLPKWFGVFWWGNGVRHSQWVPKQRGRGDAWALSPTLAPLLPVKSYVTVVTGTSLTLIDGEVNHSQGICNILAGGERVGPTGPTATQPGPTVDQIVARAFAATTPLRSLEVGIVPYKGLDQGTTNKYLSHNGPKNFNPPEFSPQKVFTRLFEGASSSGGQVGTSPGDASQSASKMAALRRSVLDAVKADAARLRMRLGAQDRARLEQHLEGIRQLEKRIELLESVTSGSVPNSPSGVCRTLGAPAVANDIEGRSKAMNRVLALALSCGVTRVFTDHFCGPRDDNVYPQSGVNQGFHGLTHTEGNDQPKVQQILSFIMKQLADLIMVLRDTPAGPGNLLDLGCLLASTDTCDGRRHNGTDWPFVLAGKAGGELKGDVHFRSAEKATNVVATALAAVGVDTPFGLSARCKPTRLISEI